MRTSSSAPFVVAVGLILAGMPTGASALADSDANLRMILDGVRASRLALREGRVEIRVRRELYAPHPQPEVYSIQAEWRDDSIRFIEIQPDGTFRRCSIRHDGELLFRQKGYGGGAFGGGVRDAHEGYVHFLFDPRLLGASPWLTPTKTAADLLFPPDSQWHAVLVDESSAIDDCECVVVRWQTHGFRQDYWIEASERFRVRKIADYNNSIEHSSLYRKDGVLPHTVTQTTINRETRAVISKTIFEVTEVDLSPVQDRIFSLAGLGLEIGEPVIDERLQQRIGFWNGRDLSPSRSEAFAFALDREPAPRQPGRWLAFLTAVLVFLLAVAILVRRAAA